MFARRVDITCFVALRPDGILLSFSVWRPTTGPARDNRALLKAGYTFCTLKKLNSQTTQNL